MGRALIDSGVKQLGINLKQAPKPFFEQCAMLLLRDAATPKTTVCQFLIDCARGRKVATRPTEAQALSPMKPQLLDFGFFVDDMLTNGRIVLLDLHFLGHIALVFVGSIKMTRSGARY